MRDKLFEQGLKLRKRVLGAAYVEKQIKNADAFSMPMQMLATKSAWGMVWTRPGLPRKIRSMLNIAMLVALGKAEELELHLDGAIRNGVTKKEIGEILLHAAIRRRSAVSAPRANISPSTAKRIRWVRRESGEPPRRFVARGDARDIDAAGGRGGGRLSRQADPLRRRLPSGRRHRHHRSRHRAEALRAPRAAGRGRKTARRGRQHRHRHRRQVRARRIHDADGLRRTARDQREPIRENAL